MPRVTFMWFSKDDGDRVFGTAGELKRIAEDHNVTFHVRTEEEDPDLLRAFYRSKYASNTPDVIIAVRVRPLEFLLMDSGELFPGTPIVSAGMATQQLRAGTLPPNVTGATLNVEYWPTIMLARTLQPEIDHVVVVTGASPNDRALEALVRDELKLHRGALTFTYISGLSVEETVQRVSDLPARTALLFVSFAQDSQGRSFLPTDAVRLIARAANVPTYVNSEDVLDAAGGGTRACAWLV